MKWLNGIDVASYQGGINLHKVAGDFVIIKATQGTTYINPYWKRQAASALTAGKLIGFYHYATGAGAAEEAAFFLKTVRPYIGKAILCIDWEQGSNNKWGNVNYCKAILDGVKEGAHVVPFLYVQQSACVQFSKVADITQYPLWVAQYYNADANKTGYLSDFRTVKDIRPWKNPAIRQYSPSGRLNGWQGALDMDAAYMTREAWNKYAAVTDTKNAATSNTKQEEKTAAVPSYKIGAYDLHDITYGSTGEAVKHAQHLLVRLGYQVGTIDGICGSKTYAALCDFQQKHHLSAVGRGTWKALMQECGLSTK